MTIKQIITILLVFFTNIACETIFIPKINFFGLRPDTVIPIIVSLSLVSGAANGAVYGFFIGLVLDIYFTKYLGMFIMGYAFWGMFMGFFSDKYYAQNGLFAFLAGTLGYFFKEFLIGIQLKIAGSNFDLGISLWRYFLPSALITGVFTVLCYLFYRYKNRNDLRRSKWDSVPTIYERGKFQR